jgi:hypothetical protein
MTLMALAVMSSSSSLLSFYLPVVYPFTTTTMTTQMTLYHHRMPPLLLHPESRRRRRRMLDSWSSFTTLDATGEDQQQQDQDWRSSSVIKTVTVVGGTHGNEYTGVWCIKAIERQRELYNNNNRRSLVEGEGIITNVDIHEEDSKTVNNNNNTNNNDTSTNNSSMKKTTNIFEMYPTIQIETLLANPLAHVQNKRFVDVDLNRQFGGDSDNTNNTTIPPSDDNSSSNDDATTTTVITTATVATTKSEYYEVERAREIEILLGKRRRTMIQHSTAQATFAAKAKQSHWAAMFSTCSYVGGRKKSMYSAPFIYSRGFWRLSLRVREGSHYLPLIIICMRDDQCNDKG